jgi:hypothetical protein
VVKLTHYFVDLRAHFGMIREIHLNISRWARMSASTMLQMGALTDDNALQRGRRSGGVAAGVKRTRQIKTPHSCISASDALSSDV